MHHRPFHVLVLGSMVTFGAQAAVSGPADELPARVAAGDVAATSAVLWAFTLGSGPVTFEFGTDPTFSRIDGGGSVEVEPGQPARLELEGLTPGTTYHYIATDSAALSDVGTFRTPAAPGRRPGLRFGVSGDWRGELAPYPAVQNAAGRDLDFWMSLGDTIYADVESPILPGVSQAMTLEEFRLKHREVYSERFGLNALGALRASTAVFATIDDHEVTNDFSGGAHPDSDPRFAGLDGDFINETSFYLDGVQAFQEFNPVRDLVYGDTGDPRTAGKRKLYRSVDFGDTARLIILDCRAFRDEPLPPVLDLNDPAAVVAFLLGSFDPSRTMLGEVQLEDLKADLTEAQEAGITWKFVVVPEPIQNLGVLAASDRFEGYAAERTEILAHIDHEGVENVVFIAADIHGTVVNNLTYQVAPGETQIETGAFEVTTGSVAYWAPFGQTLIAIGVDLGLITPEQLAIYNALDLDGKDEFLRELLDLQLAVTGYVPSGLEGSPIPATLLEGGYVATHRYGWTEFEIDAETAALTVTTWGIEPYDEATLLADPDAVVARQPDVVSRFVVDPVGLECAGDLNRDGSVDGADLGLLVAAWATDDPAADLDGNGIVDGADLGVLLGAWGDC